MSKHGIRVLPTLLLYELERSVEQRREALVLFPGQLEVDRAGIVPALRICLSQCQWWLSDSHALENSVHVVNAQLLIPLNAAQRLVIGFQQGQCIVATDGGAELAIEAGN